MKYLSCCIALALGQLSSLTRGADICADAIPDCHSYGQNVCVNYKPWAQINCAYYCGFCKGTPPPKDCKDFVTDCNTYVPEMCTSSEYKVWAEDHCPKYCGFCTTTGLPHATAAPTTPSTVGTTVPGCFDSINFCLIYSPSACNDNVWASTYCKKFCKIC